MSEEYDADEDRKELACGDDERDDVLFELLDETIDEDLANHGKHSHSDHVDCEDWMVEHERTNVPNLELPNH